ncbi:MAG: RecQ family ATP-dependent DNA helicase [Chitinophagales bacterium]|nr:RecQ family ATP-dependent DNA helicase [Chitinophagales bacterium]
MINDPLLHTLEQYWGYKDFRAGQRAIIEAAIKGQDVLALLPTGGGKSICFQVPGLLRDGICLVITPLVALMKDQVEQLKKRGIAAEAIYAGMSHRDIDRILDNAVFGGMKFLYLSPERLQTELFKARFDKMPIGLIAIDEAHCVTHWGYDFRPPYLQIAELRNIKPDVPFLAVTATATEEARKDIIHKLQLKNPFFFVKSFERSNLVYSIVEDAQKMDRLIKIVRFVTGSGIVYVRTRKEARDVCEWLDHHHIAADYYHAGLPIGERFKRQQAWIEGRTRIMVATNAFGMGIDKPDVRLVVHMMMPDAPEAYYQEAGRAGRDNLLAYAILLKGPHDIEAIKDWHAHKFPSIATVRTVYDALANYWQIALGDAFEESYAFDLADFCKKFEQNAADVNYALLTLAREGLISFTEGVFKSSKIRFTMNRNDLYRFEVENRSLEPLLKTMLRTYSLGSGDWVNISEARLAHSMNGNTSAVKDGLDRLDQLQVIEYSPGTSNPQVTFLHRRCYGKDLTFDMKRLHQLEQQALLRMQAMIAYTETDTCRSKLLLAYFGEIQQQDCGQCDVCRKKMKSTQSEMAWQQQVNAFIENWDSPEAITWPEFEQAFPNVDESELVQYIHWLCRENKLQEEEEGWRKLAF